MQQKVRHKSGKKKQSQKTGQRISQTHRCRHGSAMQSCHHSKTGNSQSKDACCEKCLGTCSETGKYPEKSMPGLLTVPFIFLIKVYRFAISPLFPPCCRFRPTCSDYALTALRVHGLFKGSVLTMWRILRCNPFTKGGYDPVPPKGAWRPSEPR